MTETNHIREWVEGISSYARYVMSKWFLIILAIAIGAVVGYVYTLVTADQYEADYSFFINNEDIGVQNGLQGILGAVGLDYSDEDKKIEKIKVIAKSDQILTEVLLSGGEEGILANRLIQIHKMEQKWKKISPSWEGFRFEAQAMDALSEQERSALRMIIDNIRKSHIDGFNYLFLHDLKSSLLDIRVVSYDQDLSYDFSHRMFDFLSRFYSEKVTEKPEQTLNVLREKQDSIQQKLNKAESGLAVYDARNMSLWSPTELYRRDKLSRDVGMYSVALGEVMKNVQLAEFVLQNSTPYFQVVDKPYKPLAKQRPYLLKCIVLGAFLGAFILLVVLIGYKFFKEALRD